MYTVIVTATNKCVKSRFFYTHIPKNNVGDSVVVLESELGLETVFEGLGLRQGLGLGQGYQGLDSESGQRGLRILPESTVSPAKKTVFFFSPRLPGVWRCVFLRILLLKV